MAHLHPLTRPEQHCAIVTHKDIIILLFKVTSKSIFYKGILHKSSGIMFLACASIEKMLSKSNTNYRHLIILVHCSEI